ncbi:MAG: hypothetical protein JW909_09345 [Planctomycetes bacterium]|nr:hypothetical protein [Planctomycetota bacterium]
MQAPGLSRYRLIRPIGRGATGVTYRARRLSDESLVAVKVFDHYISFDEDYRNACIRGAFAAGNVANASAVGVLECVEDSGRLILASELVEGEPLARMLQRNVRFNERDTAKLLLVLLRLVKAASEAGLHHGHLHPGKILMAGDGRPRILGSAMPVHDRMFRSEEAHPDGYTWPLVYQAPERLDLSSCAATEAVDLYSIGAVGYHMLTGYPPFHSEHLPSLRIEKVSPIEWPHGIVKNESLRVLVSSLLSPAPAERPCLEDVERVLIAAIKGKEVLLRGAAPARFREPVHSTPLNVMEAAAETPRTESPFMLPALLALLVLIIGMVALLKVFVYGPQSTEPETTAVVNPRPLPAVGPAEPAGDAAAPQPQPAEVTPVKTASAAELAAQELKAIEEVVNQSGELPPALEKALRRIAAEFHDEVWGVKAELILARAAREHERQAAEILTELKSRVRQALADYRVKDALAAVDDAATAAPASLAAALEDERSAILAEMPLMYARIRTRAEILAATNDFAAAYAEYEKITRGFPQGEWLAKAQAAVDGLKEIEERRAAAAADRERRERSEAERSTYEAILRTAFQSASSFHYEQALTSLEQGFAALRDRSLKQGLSVYIEAVRAEAEFFETVSGRLSRGEAAAILHFRSDATYLTVVGIGSSGVALRSESLERVIYPWRRLDDYQKLQLFDMCARKNSGQEMLALAAVAFHRGLPFEGENYLTAAGNLTPGLKSRALTWRGIFTEIETLARPTGARSTREE